jgi:K+-sensing histidine kinase KdpD
MDDHITAEEIRRAISHDLRQPLTALMTRSDLLRMRLERVGLASDARHAEMIGETAQRMDALIDEVVARIASSTKVAAV